MISLGLAKKLMDAGLEWEPHRGDWFVYAGTTELAEFVYRGLKRIKILDDTVKFGDMEESFWLPSLSQLLAEVRKRTNLLFGIDMFDGTFCVYIQDCKKRTYFESRTIEDSVGKGLLYLLEQGQ